MNFVLGFVFLLCLLLLLLIFGEQLSVLGALHGRWLTALSDGMSRLWDHLCEVVDRAWSFVLEHLWWVMAIGSGSIGLCIVAWLLFGGLAEQARAEIANSTGILNAGGLLDTTPQIDSKTEAAPLRPVPTDKDLARMMHQVPSPGGFPVIVPADFELAEESTPTDRIRERPSELLPPRVRDLRPEPRRESESDGRVRPRDFLRSDAPLLDFPELPEFGPRLPSSPDRVPEWDSLDRPARNRDTQPEESELSLDERWPSRREEYRREDDRRPRRPLENVVEEGPAEDDDSLSETRGRVLDRGATDQAITSALRTLQADLQRRRDRWERSRPRSDRDADVTLDRRDRLPESSRNDVLEQERGIRIVRGDRIAESELQIEKRVPRSTNSRTFRIQIRVTNNGRRQLSGLLVREFLPREWQPVDIRDRGTFRDSQVTWLVNDLGPLESRVLTVDVHSDLTGRQQPSRTEVSALAAVATDVQVEESSRSRGRRRNPDDDPRRDDRRFDDRDRPTDSRSRDDRLREAPAGNDGLREEQLRRDEDERRRERDRRSDTRSPVERPPAAGRPPADLPPFELDQEPEEPRQPINRDLPDFDLGRDRRSDDRDSGTLIRLPDRERHPDDAGSRRPARPDLVEPRARSQPESARRADSQLPDIDLQVGKVPVANSAGRPVRVLFRIRNNGPGEANGIQLKVNLPPELDHESLLPTDTVVREVEARVESLPAGASRDIPLKIIPITEGTHHGTVQILLNGMQFDMQPFEVRAGSMSDTPNRSREAPVIPIQPQPDRSIM